MEELAFCGGAGDLEAGFEDFHWCEEDAAGDFGDYA